MIKEGDKLYIVTRRDISPGYQLAQSCHALRQFTHEWPEIDRAWFLASNYLVVLSVENEAGLYDLVVRAENLGIKLAKFHEPDLDNQLTAISLEPGSKTSAFCAHLPLALSEVTCEGQGTKSMSSTLKST